MKTRIYVDWRQNQSKLYSEPCQTSNLCKTLHLRSANRFWHFWNIAICRDLPATSRKSGTFFIQETQKDLWMRSYCSTIKWLVIDRFRRKCHQWFKGNNFKSLRISPKIRKDNNLHWQVIKSFRIQNIFRTLTII